MTSNEQFFALLRQVLHQWCDRRALRPLAIVLPSYVGFAGLSDSWHELRDALRSALAHPQEISDEELATIAQLLKAVDRALDR
jgi:hypothetical protein